MKQISGNLKIVPFFDSNHFLLNNEHFEKEKLNYQKQFANAFLKTQNELLN
jgi:hypothetical protein